MEGTAYSRRHILGKTLSLREIHFFKIVFFMFLLVTCAFCFLIHYFINSLAAPQPTLGRYLRGNLSHPIVATVYSF